MKKILGLDLGTTSIGWALVNEAENNDEKSSITKLGVRVVPLTVDEQSNFEKGKSITTNADRTLKRSMRRNLQRYKLRRENLIECLTTNHIIQPGKPLCEEGAYSTFQTYRARAKAATEEVSLLEFARILLMINKKRGYKSSRKNVSGDDGVAVDGMGIAKILYDEKITPAEYTLRLLRNNKKYIPDYYRSDLLNELQLIWASQISFHADMLTDEVWDKLNGKNKSTTEKLFYALFQVNSVDFKVKERRLETVKLRVKALTEELTREELVTVVSDINGAINGSSGLLGAISDRSKELYFNNLTVGQYLMQELEKDPHFSLKNKTFYRQDYLDEFERIWECQAKFHAELTHELKEEIRDIIIFYQRPLKSKKGMLDVCTFERWQAQIVEDGKKRTKTVGRKVCPKSSPLFQEYKIWQILNNLIVENTVTGQPFTLEQDEKNLLFHELQYKEKLSKKDILKLLYGKNSKFFDLNYKEIEGNCTLAALYKAFLQIVFMSGHEEYDLAKICAADVEIIVKQVFETLGINTGILSFDASLSNEAFERQPLYQLWHLLYSYEGDDSKTGNETLINKLMSKYGFERDYAVVLANITFKDDYSSLCTKAIRKILPFLKDGNTYDKACMLAGYNFSERSLTKEQLESKNYVDHLELLPRNSLRNPVVEKILNQMINVVNQVCDTYGKPDEIRIELARELKRSASERAEMTSAINTANLENERLRKEIQEKCGIANVSKNDLVRYKLYLELKDNGFKTLYTNTYIPLEKLFGKEFDIEHIIPQSRLFDDSFSNKTLEARQANIDKGRMTAFDYVKATFGEDGAVQYKERIDNYYRSGRISKSKHAKLLMTEKEIPTDFIDRDLRNSQYIAKKAREILEQMVMFVYPTTGSITDRLRQDWQLVDVMQELNWDKYNQLGMTYTFKDKDDHEVRRITDWTKRNDHRHHAMDALTIAFTKPEFVQYLNNVNANSDKSSSIYGIEHNCTERINGKRRFRAPMPLDEFRAEAKRQLENILVSIKAKNKVMTWNVNRSKKKDGLNKKAQLTPRGQLHNETVYGHTLNAVVKEIKVDGKMTTEVIRLITNKSYRDALSIRLDAFGGDAKKAFTGKMSLDKTPLWLNADHTKQVPTKVKIVTYEDCYPIRKPITKDLKVDKVMDLGVRKILEQRLAEFGGDAAKAFTNLDTNPIWQNREKGIDIKRVRISGITNAVALREKHDKYGMVVNDSNAAQPSDFVNTSNNHHVAIFRDSKGNLQEHIVSFYEATARAALGYEIVDKDYNKELGWEFLFTMKQNEYFVIPSKEEGFNPSEIDLKNADNAALVSKHLYRVQSISSKDYFFRHHLETTVDYNDKLKGKTWIRYKSCAPLEGMVKVRINHIGEIVAVGEY